MWLVHRQPTWNVFDFHNAILWFANLQTSVSSQVQTIHKLFYCSKCVHVLSVTSNRCNSTKHIPLVTLYWYTLIAITVHTTCTSRPGSSISCSLFQVQQIVLWRSTIILYTDPWAQVTFIQRLCVSIRAGKVVTYTLDFKVQQASIKFQLTLLIWYMQEQGIQNCLRKFIISMPRWLSTWGL